MSKKIVVTQKLDFYPDHVERLKSLGDVKIYNDMPKSHDDWLKRCKGFDIILSGKFGLVQKYQKLKDVFISVPFVGTSWADRDILKKNNITVSTSPG
ncbi:hydroxyacid dehydrogenase, partial [Candidatus Aenigmatarchaeota archaeon]